MAVKCENCTEKCPQAEMAHNAALGRMYATKEFVALLNKVESGELVEVVRCKDCKHRYTFSTGHTICEKHYPYSAKDDDFCSYGERRERE